MSEVRKFTVSELASFALSYPATYNDKFIAERDFDTLSLENRRLKVENGILKKNIGIAVKNHVNASYTGMKDENKIELVEQILFELDAEISEAVGLVK